MTYHNRFLLFRLTILGLLLYFLQAEAGVFQDDALGSGLPKLGMMISQTRVSDTGSDVNYKSDSLGEPESLFWLHYSPFLGMESSVPNALLL